MFPVFIEVIFFYYQYFETFTYIYNLFFIVLLTLSLIKSFTGGRSVSSLPFSIWRRNSIFFLLARKHMLCSVRTVMVSGSSYPKSQV